MVKISGQIQFAYNKKNKSDNKKISYEVKTKLYPFIEDFIVNNTKWKPMPKHFNGINGAKDDSRFISSMLTYGPNNKRMIEDIRKEVNQPYIMFSHREIIDAIVFIIQSLDIDVLTLKYLRKDTIEEYKSIWDKISERGHV
jgi:hypothetical protein